MNASATIRLRAVTLPVIALICLMFTSGCQLTADDELDLTSNSAQLEETSSDEGVMDEGVRHDASSSIGTTSLLLPIPTRPF